MDFQLKHGPWKELFSGRIEGSPLEIYTNPDFVILVGITEKEGQKTVGMVVECFRAFDAKGEIEKFVSSFPREANVLIKHNPDKTRKFLLMSSKASYVEYSEEKINKELDFLFRNIDEHTQAMKDVSKAYELILTDLKQADDETKEAFFVQPLLMMFLAPLKERLDSIVEKKRTSFGSVTLGVTKEGTIADEPIALFKKTIISEGKEHERLHAMHLLVEGSMLSGANAIIVGWQNLFSGLVNPTKRLSELQKFRIELDPIGFPVKDFFAEEQVTVSIDTLSPKGFPEIFGFTGNAASKKISEIIKEQKPASIKEIEKKLGEAESKGDFNEYQRHSALRFLALVESMYPKLIGKKIDVEKFSKGGVKGIGRANIIHLENLDDRAKLIVLNSLTNCLYRHFSEKGSSKELKAIVFLPSALELISIESHNAMTQEIIENFEKLEKYGIGFVLEAEKESELPEKIRENAEARIVSVKGADAGIHLKNHKPYRVYLRPGLSSEGFLDK